MSKLNIAEIIALCGGSTHVAAQYEPPISPQSVSQWGRRGVPLKRARKLAAMACKRGLTITAAQICPALAE